MIINKRTGKVISREEKVCDNIFSQARGLMFARKKNALMFFSTERMISVHNFFVFYPLTLIFIHRSRVVEIKKNFYPFTFYKSKTTASNLLETPFDMEVKVGDKLQYLLK